MRPSVDIALAHRVRRTSAAIVAGIAMALAISLAGCATASPSATGKTINVTHGVATAVYVDAGDSGQSVGDLRYFSLVTAGDGGHGRLEAVLTTTAMNTPQDGIETRLGELIFTFGSGSDQVVVLGASVYPSAGSTIAEGTSTIRPIVGGSGTYAGAIGWCESFHLADGTWQHVLHLQS